MNNVFSDKSIKSLKPEDKKYTLTERTGERGESRLQINVYPSGVKKFQIQYFLEGNRRRLEFGKYGQGLGNYSLREARLRFNELANLVKKSIDPKNMKTVASKLDMASLNMLYTMFAEYFTATKKTNSVNTILGLIKKNTDFQTNTHTQACDFTSDDARQIIYNVWNDGKKDAALSLKSALSSMFKYAIDYDNGPERFGKPALFNIKTNPIRDISLNHKAKAGSRWLTETEINTLWHTTTVPPILHNYLKLQIALAGQRVVELSHCNISEFDLTDNLFTIPKARIKIAQRGDHTVPLGSIAISTYHQSLKFRNANGHLFPGDHHPSQPIPYLSLRKALYNWVTNQSQIKPFTLRDIRRTCKTLMTKAGINTDHRDMLQQHFKKDVATVHYDRYNYLKEKRQAMQIWDHYLQQIIQ